LVTKGYNIVKTSVSDYFSADKIENYFDLKNVINSEKFRSLNKLSTSKAGFKLVVIAVNATTSTTSHLIFVTC